MFMLLYHVLKAKAVFLFHSIMYIFWVSWQSGCDVDVLVLLFPISVSNQRWLLTRWRCHRTSAHCWHTDIRHVMWRTCYVTANVHIPNITIPGAWLQLSPPPPLRWVSPEPSAASGSWGCCYQLVKFFVFTSPHRYNNTAGDTGGEMETLELLSPPLKIYIQKLIIRR